MGVLLTSNEKTAGKAVSESGMTQLILSFRSQKNAAVEPDWFPKPGYTYCVTRAISARINQNYDAWPSSELKKMVPTWIGKPCFVNHNNDDIERSRGKIIAARYIESSDDKYIETVMEVDAKTFPRLAKEIREGGLDSVSIGIEAGLTICSYCGNKATDEPEFCDHVRYHKGEKLPKTNQKTGKTENVLVYESCYKLTGFELSFVFDPADETAVVSRVIAANKKESYDNWDSYDPDHEPKKPGKIRQKIKEFFDPDEILDELRRERKLRDFRDDYKTHKELVHVGSRRHGYGETQAPEDGVIRDGYSDGHGEMPGIRESKAPRDQAPSKGPVRNLLHEGTPSGGPGVGRTSSYDASGEVGASQGRKKKSASTSNELRQTNFGGLSGVWAGASLRDSNSERSVRQLLAEGQEAGSSGGGGTPSQATIPAKEAYALGSGGNQAHNSQQRIRRTQSGGRPGQSGAEQLGDGAHLRHGAASGAQAGSGRGSASSQSPSRRQPAGESGAMDNFSARRGQGRGFDRVAGGAPSSRNSSGTRLAWGEVTAPADIDTLRDEDGETAEDYQFVEPVEDNDASEDIPFEHWIESPEELLTPDLGQTKRLDREQEDEGLDTDRRVEDVEDIMSDDEADMAQPPLQGRQAMARTGKDNRVDPDDLKDYSRGVPEIFRDMDEDSGDFFDYVDSIRPKKARRRQAAEVPDELLEHITEDLEELEQFTGEGYEDEYEEMPEEGDDYEAMEAMEEALGADLDGDGEEGEDAQHAEAVLGGEPQLMQASRRRPVGTMSSARKSRSTRRKGSSMAGSLSERYRVARRSEQSEDGYGHSYDTTRVRGRETNGRGEPVNEYGERTGEPALESDYQGRHRAARRRRRADTSGHVDGGPYGNDSDQGNLEEVYISQVPAAEAVAAPADDESNISNTEQTLVAHRLQREIKARAADLQRYLTAYRRVAGDNIETPSEVNPALSGTDQQDLKGDFESVQPEDVHTQPKDASVRVFRAFDNWLRSTTGRTAAQHGNANFIRRQAASYSKAAGIPLEKMFPALDVVLRQTRKAERSAPMNRRRAEFDGATVAPDARIDVEAPVKNVTDADAQASQYDLGDYGNNAGDDIANPNTETDSQIWAPKEGNRKADAVAAVRYAEAYINAGLPCEDKWKLVAQAQTIRHATVVDRTRLLEYVAQTNAARSKKVTAAVSRGTTNGIPKGLTAPRPAQRTAANDSADDFGLWF